MKLADLYGADAKVIWFSSVDYITESEVVTEWSIKTRKKNEPDRSS